MPLPTTLNHFTLNTDHNRSTPLREVQETIRELLREWLPTKVNSGKYHPLPTPGLDFFVCRITAEGSALFATLAGTRMPQPHDPPGTPLLLPLLSFGIAPDQVAADHLWPILLGHCLGAQPKNYPSTPWCSVAIYPTLATYPAPTDWVGDFERCIAWAWLARVEEEKPTALYKRADFGAPAAPLA